MTPCIFRYHLIISFSFDIVYSYLSLWHIFLPRSLFSAHVAPIFDLRYTNLLLMMYDYIIHEDLYLAFDFREAKEKNVQFILG